MKKMTLFFFIITIFSCEKYPKNDTIIEGKVLDSFGKPIEKTTISVLGTCNTGFFQQTVAFRETVKNDINGYFKFSKVVVKGTDLITVSILDSPMINIGDSILIQKNNSEFGILIVPQLIKKDFGKTNVINFRIHKK